MEWDHARDEVQHVAELEVGAFGEFSLEKEISLRVVGNKNSMTCQTMVS
jgi:hypothetical protein